VRRRPPPAKAPSGLRNAVLALVVLLAGAMATSAGYRFGQSALEEVNTPKTALGNEKRKSLGKSQGLLRESDILATLTNLPEVGDAPELTAEEILEQQEDEAASDPSVGLVKVGARTTEQEVTLAVETVAWQGQNLTLQVSLQNKSYHPIRFVFSPAFDLLKVTDDQGRTVRTLTEGLPGELPDDQELYKGTIQIPVGELGRSRSLSLSLNDYPDREVQLLVEGIPVPVRPK
jgi:hypothetical protein